MSLNFPGLMENSYTRNQLLSVVKNELELIFNDEDGGLSTKDQPKDIWGSPGQSAPTKGRRSREQACQLAFSSSQHSEMGEDSAPKMRAF